MFLFWIITAGPKWLRRIVKEELAVSLSTFDVQKYSEAFLHVVTCLIRGTLGLPGDCKNASEYFCILILVMLQAGMLLSHEVAYLLYAKVF